jgi:hypothetical protein
MWKRHRTRATTRNSVAIRRARPASLILARSRMERDDIDALLADSAERFEQPLGG